MELLVVSSYTMSVSSSGALVDALWAVCGCCCEELADVSASACGVRGSSDCALVRLMNAGSPHRRKSSSALVFTVLNDAPLSTVVLRALPAWIVSSESESSSSMADGRD